MALMMVIEDTAKGDSAVMLPVPTSSKYRQSVSPADANRTVTRTRTPKWYQAGLVHVATISQTKTALWRGKVIGTQQRGYLSLSPLVRRMVHTWGPYGNQVLAPPLETVHPICTRT